MNRDDVIRMAREAGLNAEADTLCSYPDHVEPLTAFATRVLMNTDPRSFMSWQEAYAAGAAAEREAICKLGEDSRYSHQYVHSFLNTIRARGQA